MKYELTLKLKEAGFPPTKSGKVVMSETQEKLFLHGAKVVEEGVCDVPTLSELIEACKEDFHSLHRLVHRSLEQERWQATGVKTKSTEHIVYGSTSEEAVAHLLIALSGGNIKQWMEKNIGTGKEKI